MTPRATRHRALCGAAQISEWREMFFLFKPRPNRKGDGGFVIDMGCVKAVMKELGQRYIYLVHALIALGRTIQRTRRAQRRCGGI